MTHSQAFNSPFLLGFEHIERLLEGTARTANESYPPYNIEHLGEDRLRISLAVAGFAPDELNVTVENNQLVIRGHQTDNSLIGGNAAGRDKTFLHRGIAARQFQRTFVLAEGMEVLSAELKHGLLLVDLERPKPSKIVRTINIRSGEVHPNACNKDGYE